MMVFWRMKRRARFVRERDEEVEDVLDVGSRFARLATAEWIERDVRSVPASSIGSGAIAPLPFSFALSSDVLLLRCSR
jgi:hypothetical protein